MKLSRRPFVDVNEVIFKSVISQVDLDCTRRLRALALSSLPWWTKLHWSRRATRRACAMHVDGSDRSDDGVDRFLGSLKPL